MKTIVTHQSPDIDAITAVWLIRRFLPEWKDARCVFVPAGETLDNAKPDDHPDILHVDTGFGLYDHHQNNDETCAAEKIFKLIQKKKSLKALDAIALERIVAVVNRYDHFKEVFLEPANDDMYDFSLAYIINGIKLKLQDDTQVVHYVETMLDGIFISFKNKINAESIIMTGFEFSSAWGKSIAFESENDETMKLALKDGFDLVIRRSGNYKYIRIKSHPKVKKSLKSIYEKLLKVDKDATWFYHSSGRMLLNGSSKAKNSQPSSLTLPSVIALIKGL
jgi:hypothetical protein